MARTRIHELARQWELGTKELVARLEKIGIHGKRSQSSLNDSEVELLRVEVQPGLKPSVNVGEERIVTGDLGQAMLQMRVGTKVIRRRAAEPAPPTDDTIPIEPLESLSSDVDALGIFPGDEPLGDIVDLPLTEAPEEPDVVPPLPPETEVADVPAPPAEASKPAEIPKAIPHEPSKSDAAPNIGAMDKPRGPRVLGRIDLKKQELERVQARERAANTAVSRAKRPASPTPGDSPAPSSDAQPGDAERGKRKRRRVVQKPEFAEIGDREKRFGRLPRKKRAQPGKEQRKTEITMPKAIKRVIRISEVVSVGELAKSMGVKAGEVVKKLMESGMMASINQVLDTETATLIASEFGYNVENVTFDAESAVEVGHEPDADEILKPRPPVITIMGHVDHGKTSLLDTIRQANVTAGEAGGITQHIGAYKVEVDGKQVTFLDTPGHEAFTAMRARGAKVTDIVVLVVAADDGVMPQTVEALNHAKAAEVPIVVAINKIDRPEANIDRIKQGLSDHSLLPEDWGGTTICVPVSAKTGDGVPQLLEMLLLQADILELKANLEKASRGVIIEAKLDRGRGPVATVLVQEGVLRPGDPFVCGAHAGRVRAMIDDKGNKVLAAEPSTPVEILGLGAVPEAGSPFVVTADEATAKQVADHRAVKLREATLLKTSKVTLEDLYRQVQAGDTKELRVVIKADVQGSVGAISDALTRLSTEEVRLNVLHASVGGITESDVMLASASNAVVIGFSVRPEAKATGAAEREGVDLRLYTVIYDALSEIRSAMEGLLEPSVREKVVGRAEVRETFSIPGIGLIAGCFVAEGKLTRKVLGRLVRDHVVVYDGKIDSLRRFKEDAREVSSGYECGVGLENFQDIKVGDVIEAFETEQVARRLGDPLTRGAPAERSL